ncbi:MAG TPA: hypothetical protein PLS20_06170 [Ruminococcus flavefaciens]|nr:hypothetical protein [Ruminococcus flavefaciens]
MKNLDLTDRAELLHDYANHVVAIYAKYTIAHDIDDEDDENIINKNWLRAVRLKNQAYGINNENEYNIIKKELDQLESELPND